MDDWKSSKVSENEIAAIKLDKRRHVRIRFWHWIAALITGRQTLHELKTMVDATPPGTCCIPRSLWEKMTVAEKQNLYVYADWHRSIISVMWKY